MRDDADALSASLHMHMSTECRLLQRSSIEYRLNIVTKQTLINHALHSSTASTRSYLPLFQSLTSTGMASAQVMRGGRERAQRNLYVLNLPLDATTDQFEALFAQFGSVEHAVILATLDHLARRRGFILMSDPAQARSAIENLNGHTWHHYRIEVSFAIVQRSGAPFSQEAAEPLPDERPAQAKRAGEISTVSDPHRTPSSARGLRLVSLPCTLSC